MTEEKNNFSSSIKDKSIYFIYESPYLTVPDVLEDLSTSDSSPSSQKLESTFESLINLDFSNSFIEESAAIPGKRQVRFRAVLQEADVPNKNGRIYPSRVLKQLVDYFKSYIQENGGLPSEVDHPLPETSDPQVIAKRGQQLFIKNTGVLFKDIDFVDGKVIAEGITLDNVNGYKVYSLIKEGFKVGFSLRAFGSLRPVTINGKQYVEVTNLTKPVTYDTVINQSHHNARLVEVLESELTSNIDNPNELIIFESVLSPTSRPIVVIPEEYTQNPDLIEEDELKKFVLNVIKSDNDGNIRKLKVRYSDDGIAVVCLDDKCIMTDKLDGIIDELIPKIDNEFLTRFNPNLNVDPISQMLGISSGINGGADDTIQSIKIVKIIPVDIDDDLDDLIQKYEDFKVLGQNTNIPDSDEDDNPFNFDINDIPDNGEDDDVDNLPVGSIAYWSYDLESEFYDIKEQLFESFDEYREFNKVIDKLVPSIKLEELYERFGDDFIFAFDENELYDDVIDTILETEFVLNRGAVDNLIKEFIQKYEKEIKETKEIDDTDIESIIFDTTEQDFRELMKSISEEIKEQILQEFAELSDEILISGAVLEENEGAEIKPITPPIIDEEKLEEFKSLYETLINDDKITVEEIIINLLPEEILETYWDDIELVYDYT